MACRKPSRLILVPRMRVRNERVSPDGDLLIILEPPTEFAPWESKSSKPAAGQSRKRPREAEPEEQLRVLVSSKHLMDASKRFKIMLSGTWLEANVVHADGLRHVDMEGFDIDAFLVVMHILHHKNRKVPEDVGLEMLAKIAVIVDDLDCLEALLPWRDQWTSHLSATSDSLRRYGRNLILWIMTSAIFNLPEFFDVATKTVILLGDGPLPTLGLPIREQVVGKPSTIGGPLCDKQILTCFPRQDQLRERNSSSRYPEIPPCRSGQALHRSSGLWL